ncbi:hypothetical protein CRG98_049733, partial [Punica granatum]
KLLDELGRAVTGRTGPAELDWAAGIRTGPNGLLEFELDQMRAGPLLAGWAAAGLGRCRWTRPLVGLLGVKRGVVRAAVMARRGGERGAGGRESRGVERWEELRARLGVAGVHELGVSGGRGS